MNDWNRCIAIISFILFLGLYVSILSIDTEMYKTHKEKIRDDSVMFASVIYSWIVSILSILISGTVCKTSAVVFGDDRGKEHLIGFFIFILIQYINTILTFCRFRKFWELGGTGVAYLTFNCLIPAGIPAVAIAVMVLYGIIRLCYDGYKSVN